MGCWSNFRYKNDYPVCVGVTVVWCYPHFFTLISTRISDHIVSKVWEETLLINFQSSTDIINQTVTKIIIDMANCNTNSIIIWGERATSIKYVNSISKCWLKLVPRSSMKENMKIFRHVNILSPPILHIYSYIRCPFIYHTSICHFIVQKYHLTC